MMPWKWSAGRREGWDASKPQEEREREVGYGRSTMYGAEEFDAREVIGDGSFRQNPK